MCVTERGTGPGATAVRVWMVSMPLLVDLLQKAICRHSLTRTHTRARARREREGGARERESGREKHRKQAREADRVRDKERQRQCVLSRGGTFAPGSAATLGCM